MFHIDEKFKDNSPQGTVENITKILNSIGIKLEENWTDSGIANCYSLRVSLDGQGSPGTNGKGVTPELARASAYGEFIERLQIGLLFYKYADLENDPEFFNDAYAPDAKYMTKQELIENGDWMDHVIDEYGGRLTREELAEQCEMYAGSEKILTVPYYSYFEDKYVYLPAAFVKQVFCSNGCCVGNSREEALIHSLSELLERHSTVEILLSGKAVPKIPDEFLKQYKSVYTIIEDLRKHDFDISVLDFSCGIDFPIVATRLINKKSGGYIISVGADPVFEIAVKRTITEVLQGKKISATRPSEARHILNSVNDVNKKNNLISQTETGNGCFTVTFFSDDLKADRKFTPFTDSADKTNKEILPRVLEIFKNIGRPLYLRNYAYLGFPCYMAIVPGYSELRPLHLNDPLQEYAFASAASKVLRNIESASDDDITELMLYYRMIKNLRSRISNYKFLSGLLLSPSASAKYLSAIHFAYAAYRLGKTAKMLELLSACENIAPNEETAAYLNCIIRYHELKATNADDSQIMHILKMFYSAPVFERFAKAKENGTFFEGMLVRCDKTNCDKCSMKDCCGMAGAKEMMRSAGKMYRQFTDGQNKENFKFDI